MSSHPVPLDPCDACGASVDEECRPGCIGEAAHLDTLCRSTDGAPGPFHECGLPADHDGGHVFDS